MMKLELDKFQINSNVEVQILLPIIIFSFIINLFLHLGIIFDMLFGHTERDFVCLMDNIQPNPA